MLENATTLHRVQPARLATERTAWRAQFADLPRPRTVVLIGGDSGPYALRAAAAHKLAAALHDRSRSSGGTIMLTTSSRTHPDAVQALAAALPNAWLYRWRAGDEANPYFGMLAWADGIVVTSDSVAMISEALAVGVPVALFDLARHCDSTLKTRAYEWLMRLGPARLTRDISLAHERLIAAGAMTRLAEDPGEDQPRIATADTALPATVARIAALLRS